ncbi:heme-dependent oxidative N-demethylase family protein [Pontixanthobacter sp.]|uniref:heme-dependent oxidative N-demethylase family protein n=1 Tax=Pontixanthobacter sp. TaxID=2792078 RepID=UPI003C7ABCEE
MRLGFSVDQLLPRARGGGQLKMGLLSLAERDWLQPSPDVAAREAAFACCPDAVQLSAAADAPGEELAAMLGVSGALPNAALSRHEDMCLLTRRSDEDIYRLVGAAVAYPTDWQPKDKMGLPLAAMHAPIHGYQQQLASGVDHFMARLKPGRIFGRCNWFIAPTPQLRWIADSAPEAAFGHVDGANAGETLFIRSERQTLRRLPETGAIVFTIGVYVAPLGSLSPGNIAMLAGAIRSLVSGEGDRRGSAYYAEALLRYAAAYPEVLT